MEKPITQFINENRKVNKMNQIIIIVDRNGIREWVKHEKFPETGEREREKN